MRALPIVIVTLTTGITIGYLINGIYSPTVPVPNTVQVKPDVVGNEKVTLESPVIARLGSDIDALALQLQEEISARKSLEDKLEKLNRQIANLENQDNLQTGMAPEQSKEVAETDGSDSQWFNEQALVDSGMSEIRATQLKSFFEQQELDRMYLRDQSIREGWDRQRYVEEIQKLSEKADSFLSQLDDTSYDAYLYASGQPNRVKVTNVLDSSQASTAGIQAGDHIISYDNKRIYNGFDLRSATTGGNINQSVPVAIERNGEVMELYLNRGPLGIRMNPVSVAPEP